MSLDRPVLLRSDNELFRIGEYVNARTAEAVRPEWRWKHLVPEPSVDLVSDRMLLRLRGMLEASGSATVLVIGGGRQRQRLDERLGAADALRIVYSDVDVLADVDLFCDGHDLPFADGMFDAVVTIAVLEHVLYPERVAAEIYRVLKSGGLLYSELPFMQQVHEGAYDFTRYTLSGHRRLFNRFAEIESGMVAGPGTALAWSIENFVLAFLRGTTVRNVARATVRILMFWLKYFDFLLAHRPEAMDGASCTFLMGRKIEGQVPDAEIVARYVGGRPWSHT
jgi:SAM-dependent methyltransferase